MLNDYMDKQELACSLFMNDISNNCVTHAYLIDENNYCDAFSMVIAFVKEILCHNMTDLDNDKISLCKRIDEGNYPELKIITADGMYIKKQQIISLQQEFSRSAIEGNKRIYIIRDCEKMRPEAANSMLKFLEEPDSDIIAILMTNNINNVLSTVISRCKVVKFNNISKQVESSDLILEDLAIKFVYNVENRGIDTIIDIKDIWFSVISAKERDRMVITFDIMIDIYYDIMRVIIGNESLKYSKYVSEIINLSNLNSLSSVLKKIELLIEAKDSIKYNVNSNLLIDSIIIGIGGISDGSRC